ncbi:MAG: primase C-terminal domain-containing protein [Spirochaetia bacterium]|nr:primase C-terminal domain-containing protein [Spirochaetia bacterium]
MQLYYNKKSDITTFDKEVNIDSEEGLKEVVQYNHTMVKFTSGYRKKANFEYCDVLYADIDNTHSEDESEWVTISRFRTLFHEYEYYLVTSKSHQKEKNGAKPRDKFHVYFPVKPLSSAEELELWLRKLTTKYRFFDPQVKDASRLFFGSPNAKVIHNRGKSIKQDLYDVEVNQGQSEMLPVNQITTGNRDDQIYRYACSLRNGGNTEEETRTLLHSINNSIDAPLSEDQVEKCIKSAFKNEANGPAKTLPKNKTIQNYYEKEFQTTSKSGAVTTFTKQYPYLEFTQDMEEPKKLFSTFIDGSGKRFLFMKEKPETFISSSEEFYVELMKEGYTLDFRSTTNITERKYMTWFKHSIESYRRFSYLPEIKNMNDTVYIPENITAENNGWFRKALDLITVEEEKDRYRFAAGLLSAFLDSRFDGEKPLFSVIAQTKSSGKSQAVRALTKIIQGVQNIEFDGHNDEAQISGIRSLANKYVLYDNLQYTTHNQMLNITKTVTDVEIPAWFMNISHSRVRNNKTYFATFNDENAFNDDILNRILTIRMRDTYSVDSEEKKKIAKSLDVIKKNRKKVLADILYHIEHVNELKEEYTYVAPPKFPKWAETISELVSTFFPDVEEFDFGLSTGDKELSTETTMMKEFLEDLFIDAHSDEIFKTSEEITNKYREHYKTPNATKASVARKIQNVSMGIEEYKVKKSAKKICGKTYRGFEIYKI